MRLPQQGHMVLYKPEYINAFQVPAIVVQVKAQGPGEFILDLAVFFNNGLVFLQNVRQGNETGNWQWADIPIQ